MYTLILLNKGDCSYYTAADTLRLFLGYDANTAMKLSRCAPVSIAENLDYEQASLLYEAMDEFGTETAVIDEDGMITAIPYSHHTSVLMPDGSLLPSLEKTIRTITAHNRTDEVKLYEKPRVRDMLFGFHTMQAL